VNKANEALSVVVAK